VRVLGSWPCTGGRGISREEAAAAIQDMMRVTRSLAVGGLDFHEMMLPDTHPAVLAELSRRQAAAVLASDGSTGWEHNFRAFLAKSGLEITDCYPPPSVRSSPWYCTIPERGQVTLGYLTHLMPGWTAIDWNQDVRRPYFSSSTTLYTLLPNVQPFARRAKRPLIGIECMMLQGIPRQVLLDNAATEARVSDACLRDLAGNAFAGTVHVAVLAGVLAGMPAGACQGPQPQAAVAADVPLEDILACVC